MRIATKIWKFVSAAAFLACSTLAVSAAESAAGAYVLGLRGPGAGVTPPTGLFFSTQMYIYGGKISGNVPVEGGAIAGNGRIKATVMIPTFLLVTPIELLGGRLGVSLTTPYGMVDVAGKVGPLQMSERRTTFADPSITSFLGWHAGNLHWQLGVTAFLPIGDYRKGALDVFGTLTWIEPTWGLDVSNTVGFTFNQENRATRYKTGTEFHWEWSIAKKFDSGFSIGPAGYFYNQLSGDTGVGTKLGAFEGRVWAIGAGIGYEFKVGVLPVTARLRYFRELETRHRLKGDTAFLGLSFPLWVPDQKR